jgi:hypothetical protein
MGCRTSQNTSTTYFLVYDYIVQTSTWCTSTTTWIRNAWLRFRNCQKQSVELRMKWLEGIARVKDASDNDNSAAKQLKLLIRNLHKKQMNQKLSPIIKGSHSGLDHIQVPTASWYFSSKLRELYHYTSKVFE